MPSPGSYTDVFGNALVFPAQPSFLSIALSTNIVLGWPLEKAPAGTTVAADLIEVTPSGGGLTIQLSDATQVSQGYYAIFNNLGASSFNVLNNGGGVIATVASGTVWYLYLADNTTSNGTWRAFQFGAGTSSATAAALAGAGLIAITTTLNENIVIQTKNTNYSFLTADRATCVEWTGGAGTGTLPVAGGVTAPAGWFVLAKNNGTGAWTISGQAGATIDGSSNLVLNPEQSCWLLTDGTNWITMGFGQQLNSIFDFISINLGTVSGTVVLSGTQLNRISYKFTGTLTGATTIQVPSTVQQYWVDNETTGAFTLTFATSAGGGALTTPVAQGTRNILYCDGVNVVPAVTFSATGFANGSAAAPSIFFTTSPHTGVYSPGADIFAITTASNKQFQIDALGHVSLPGSQDGAASLQVTGPNGGVGPAVTINQLVGGAASSPHIACTNSAVNGFATISVAANTFTTGTSDVALLQNSSGGGVLINRFNNASGSFSIQTANGSAGILLSPGGIGILQAFNTVLLLGLQGVAGSINFQSPTTNSATAGGASALPATPVGYMEIQVNNGTARLPYYAP